MRMVMTPWYDEEIPFNMAAEIGTKKVITEHSTIVLLSQLTERLPPFHVMNMRRQRKGLLMS